ncbi:MAG TPA: class I SAM-dependent methyltransferase [Vicinamibacterales bacterium]
MFSRAFAAASLLFDRGARVWMYAAVGAGSLDQLRRDSAMDWRRYNDRTETIRAGLLPAEQQFVGEWVPAGGRILLIGSGSGRELVHLARGGFSVTGVEPVSHSVDMCRAALHVAQVHADVRTAFIEDVALADDSFDAAMFSLFVYSLIPMSARRIATVRRVARAVKPGGVLFVSFSTNGAGNPWLVRVGRAAGALARSDWRLESGDSVFRISAQQFRYTHIFSRSQIYAELDAAGLQRIEDSFDADYPFVVAQRAANADVSETGDFRREMAASPLQTF